MDNVFQTQIEEKYTNLADSTLNAKALFASDDFFAAKERMLNPTEPEWKEDVYDENGKWMDGWESRRKREHGHDFCIVRLCSPGTIHIIDIYTRFFTGNYPPVASLDACLCKKDPDENTEWVELLTPQPVNGDSHNYFELSNRDRWSHIRLNIYPDGGVARLRLYGETE